MRKVVVVENVSLDGVMQAPGRAGEDPRGGFTHGGWAMAYNDEVKGRLMASGMVEAGPLLFGRRTYEDFFKVWSSQSENPFSKVLDAAPKYVVSTTLSEPLPWQNSTLLQGDAAAAVARLKGESGRDILVMGSGLLVETLLRQSLVDELILMIHPLVLGQGHRLFPEAGTFAPLSLVDAQPTTTGVIVATYRVSDAEANARR